MKLYYITISKVRNFKRILFNQCINCGKSDWFVWSVRKIVCNSCGLGLFIFVLFFFSNTAFASTLIFSDDFNRADSTNIGVVYTEASGGWDIVSNQLKLNSYSSGSNRILSFWDYVTYDGTILTPDYEIEATFNIPSSNQPMLGCRFQNSSNFYGVEFIESTDNINLFRVVAGTQTSLGTYGTTVNTGVNYTAKLSCVGNTIKLYWNGVLRITATDSNITYIGKPIISSSAANLVYDNFNLYTDIQDVFTDATRSSVNQVQNNLFYGALLFLISMFGVIGYFVTKFRK